MSRDITTPVLGALDDDVISPFFAVDLDFDSVPLYLWSGYGNLTIGSKVYLGAGDVLNISSITETAEVSARGATITLSGVPSSKITLALQTPYQGRECRIYFGVVSDPNDYVEVFSGEIDQMNVEESGDSASISVTVENVLIRLERPVIRRLTNEDQKSRYPDDKGLEFVASLQEKELFWGKATP
jgi:hypothetical protein